MKKPTNIQFTACKFCGRKEMIGYIKEDADETINSLEAEIEQLKSELVRVSALKDSYKKIAESSLNRNERLTGELRQMVRMSDMLQD
jgi:prefoldin subunit 5